ncbi:MAG: hypothetical protein ACOYKE_03520 [Ferruginibacter sp.]
MKKQYWVIVEHVDNRLVISLNGNKVWDSDIIYEDPLMNKRIEITDLLQPGDQFVNELIFEGYNGAYGPNEPHDVLNPWHFTYRIVSRTFDDAGNLISEIDMARPYDEKHVSNPDIWAINNRYQLVNGADGFIIKSNFLSQQFYK